ncbi:MAG TPA: hypothetical protein V6D20_05050, partial [Candidatus Obscuribacterales bacterium]
EFEVLYALAVADLRKQTDGSAWGPFGRFTWKYTSGDKSPFHKVVNEATKQKEQWLPIKGGMFEGSYERFEAVANDFSKLMNELSWS